MLEVETRTVSPTKRRLPWRWFIFATVMIAIVVLAGGLILSQPWNPNPFSPGIEASAQFPLYYPAKIPPGFRLNRRSVNEPATGVVVFTLSGPNKSTIYISEEARPDKFDLGGFYATFRDFKSVNVSDGSIAGGKLRDGLTTIASRANNKTWIIANTKDAVSRDDLIEMLKSLTHAI